MYQYRAILKSTREIVAEGHSIEDVEEQVVGFRRGQKRGEHTNGNVPIELVHMKKNADVGITEYKEELIKVI